MPSLSLDYCNKLSNIAHMFAAVMEIRGRVSVPLLSVDPVRPGQYPAEV